MMLDHHQYGIKVTYHALFMCDFELTQDDYKKILAKCAEVLCNFVKNSSTRNLPDAKISVAMALRIVANLIALRSDNALTDFVGLLALQNETVSNCLNDILKIDSVYKNEILWLAGNIYQADANFRDEIVGMLRI